MARCPRPLRMSSAAFSAIMIVGAAVCPPGILVGVRVRVRVGVRVRVRVGVGVGVRLRDRFNVRVRVEEAHDSKPLAGVPPSKRSEGWLHNFLSAVMAASTWLGSG